MKTVDDPHDIWEKEIQWLRATSGKRKQDSGSVIAKPYSTKVKEERGEKVFFLQGKKAIKRLLQKL